MSENYLVGGFTEIDPRSFHVYEEQGTLLLFDRANAALLEIPPNLYSLLKTLQEGLPPQVAMERASLESSPEELQLMLEALAELSERGSSNTSQ